MKISNETLALLKSYANINPSIWVEPGNILRTVSPQKTIMARCEVDDNFETEFGIYDLNQFLATIHLFEEPEFHFDQNEVRIAGGSSSVRYAYCDKKIITIPPNKEINLPDEVVKFNLSHTVLSKSIQASNVLGLPNISVVGTEGHIHVVSGDMRNKDGNVFRTVVGETQSEFDLGFKVENLRLLPNDYTVRISSKGISHFSALDGKIQFWVATESN